jgi:hypothetical protein
VSPRTFGYQGYDIPIDIENLTGGGPDTFGRISEGHVTHFRKHVGLWEGQEIVEIGCGRRPDAIPLAKIIGYLDGIFEPTLPNNRLIGVEVI